MKKILISVTIIGIVAVIAIGGTIAYFSDTETSSGNTLTAGTLNLQVGNDDPCTVHLDKDNIAPGDALYGGGYTGLWKIKNTGTIDGKLSFEFTSLVDNDNSCNDPEMDAEELEYGSGGATCGDGEGELSDNLHVTVVVTDPDGTPHKVWPIGVAVKTLKETADEGVITITGDPGLLEGGETGGTFHLKVIPLDSSVGNIVQSDSVEFDIIFYLDQVITP